MTPGLVAALWCSLALGLLVLVPGVALWSALRLDRSYRGITAWAVAATLGFSFWPMLLVLTTAMGLRVGQPLAWGLLGVGLAVVLRRSPRLMALAPRGLIEGLCTVLLLVVLATRLWVALRLPFPAWVDSLHHVLLAERVAADGALPSDLGPLYPQIPTGQYHLGLHGLAGMVAMLSGVAPHTAVLWTAQVANALTAATIWAFLRQRAGLLAALIGATTVGLFAHFPALFVSWGRYPQTVGQALLPVAWLLGWDLLAMLGHLARRSAPPGRAPNAGAGRGLLPAGPAGVLLAQRLSAALLAAAGVMAIHFRVGIFLLLGLGCVALFEWTRVRRRGVALQFLFLLLPAGLLLGLAFGPRVWRAASVYLGTHWLLAQARGSLFAAAGDILGGIEASYFGVALRDVPYLVASPWLLFVALVLGAIGIWRGSAVCRVGAGWILAMLGLATVAHLGLPVLVLTNEGGVLIALHLGLALLLGGGSQELLRWLPVAGRRRRTERWLATVVTAAALAFAPLRAWPVEGERFFVTHQDLAAYRWIDENLPASAKIAINTTFWLPNFPHGTDGGWWIPYFARRRVVPGPMITPLSPGFQARNVAASYLIERLSAGDPAAAQALWASGIEYVYVGEGGDSTGPALDPERLRTIEPLVELYRKGRVALFQIRAPAGSTARAWFESAEGKRIMAELKLLGHRLVP